MLSRIKLARCVCTPGVQVRLPTKDNVSTMDIGVSANITHVPGDEVFAMVAMFINSGGYDLVLL